MYFLLAWICFHQNKLQPAAFHPAAQCWSLEGDAVWMWSWWTADVLSFLLSPSVHTHMLQPWQEKMELFLLWNRCFPPTLCFPLTLSPTPWEGRCCSLCSVNNPNFIQEENTNPSLRVQFLQVQSIFSTLSLTLHVGQYTRCKHYIHTLNFWIRTSDLGGNHFWAHSCLVVTKSHSFLGGIQSHHLRCI